jgi:hypothetical protein
MTLSSSVNGGIYGYMDGARAQGGGWVSPLYSSVILIYSSFRRNRRI